MTRYYLRMMIKLPNYHKNKVSIMNLNYIYELEHEGHNTIFSKRMRLGIHIRMNYKKG